MNTFRRDYFEAIVDTDRELALQVIDSCIDAGQTPETIMFEVLVPAIEDLAEKVRVGPDATLAQLYLASQVSNEIFDRLSSQFQTSKESRGRVIIGTSFEDFHGLGKKIVKGCLQSYMIDVVDLGLNVPAEKFVDEAVTQQAEVIAISSMMVHTARGENGPLKVRELLKERQLENRLRLVVGGAPYCFHPSLYKEVGADGWSDNGLSAAKLIDTLIKEVQVK